MAARDVVNPVVEALRALDLSIQHLRVEVARSLGITVADTLVLSELAHADDQTLRPRDIAVRLDLGTGTLTAMLDRLETARLISRLPNPRDRRSTLIRLDARGRRALANSAELLTSAVESAAVGSAAPADFAIQIQAVADRIIAVSNAGD